MKSAGRRCGDIGGTLDSVPFPECAKFCIATDSYCIESCSDRCPTKFLAAGSSDSKFVAQDDESGCHQTVSGLCDGHMLRHATLDETDGVAGDLLEYYEGGNGDEYE